MTSDEVQGVQERIAALDAQTRLVKLKTESLKLDRELAQLERQKRRGYPSPPSIMLIAIWCWLGLMGVFVLGVLFARWLEVGHL